MENTTPPPSQKEVSILNGARELVMQYGVRSLTMDDIASHLGISKKTLYQFVANKAELVHKVTAQMIEYTDSQFCKHIQEDWNPIDELIRIYEQNSKMALRMNHTILHELRKFYPESFKLLEEHKWNRVYHQVLENMQRGQKIGLYRQDMNIEIIGRAHTARIFDLFGSEVFKGINHSMSGVFKEILIYHIRGISSKAGIEYLESLGKIEF